MTCAMGSVATGEVGRCLSRVRAGQVEGRHDGRRSNWRRSGLQQGTTASPRLVGTGCSAGGKRRSLAVDRVDASPGTSSEAVPKPLAVGRAGGPRSPPASADRHHQRHRADRRAGPRLIAAAVRFNRREEARWWRHFDRLRHPVDGDWAGQADVPAHHRGGGVSGWEVPGPGAPLRQTLRLTGHPGRGSRPIPAEPASVSLRRAPHPRPGRTAARCPRGQDKGRRSPGERGHRRPDPLVAIEGTAAEILPFD